MKVSICNKKQEGAYRVAVDRARLTKIYTALCVYFVDLFAVERPVTGQWLAGLAPCVYMPTL